MTAKYKRGAPTRRRKMIADLYAVLVRAEAEVHAAEERERRLASAQDESDAALASKYRINAGRY
jgi:hypothetical protein